MSNEVRQLRPAAPSAELEHRYIGAMLDSAEPLELLDASFLQREDFEGTRRGWALHYAHRIARMRQPVTASTIVALGKTEKNLSDNDLPWLTDAQMGNRESRESALFIAEQLRMQSRARSTVKSLEEEIAILKRGGFNPGRTSGVLEGLAHGLSRDFVADETGDVHLMALAAKWKAHADAGTSELDPWGIEVMDNLCGGGKPEKLILIAGAPGGGKTALMSSSILATHMRDEHLPHEDQSTTGVFGLEDGIEGLTRRWVAQLAQLKLQEVGWKKYETEQELKIDSSMARLEPLLKRVICYTRERIPAREMIRRATNWVFVPRNGRKRGVRRLFTDHLLEVDHRDPKVMSQRWEEIEESLTHARDFCNRYGVSWTFLVHDTEDTAAKPGGRGEGPPNPAKLAGGRSLDRKARQIWGVWPKGGKWGEWRATLLKNTGGPGAGETVGLERLYESAMVTPTGGRKIDVEAEDNAESAKRRDKADTERRARDKVRRAANAAEKAAEKEAAAKLEAERKAAAPAPAQAALLEVPTSTKPGAA